MSNVLAFTKEIEIPEADAYEGQFLGELMWRWSASAVAEAKSLVNVSHFGSETCRLVYKAMLELADAQEASGGIEMCNVVFDVYAILQARKDQRSREIGRIDLSNFMDQFPRMDYLAPHAKKIRAAAEARRVQVAVSTLGDIVADGGSAAEIRERMQRTIDGAFDDEVKGGVVTGADEMARAVAEMQAAHDARENGEFAGIPTGLYSVDRLLGGMQRKLYVIAGRPGVGKSSLASGWALNALRQEKRVLIFSAEMSGKEIMQRFASQSYGVDSDCFNTLWFPGDNGERWKAAQGYFAETGDRLQIDVVNLSPSKIRARSQRAQQEGGIDLVIVDYLQILQSEGRQSNETERVSRLSNEMKQIQHSLGVPMLLLSQLSRSSVAEKRAPQLHDLRQSGAIEQDCDVAIMLWAPDGDTESVSGERRVDLCVRKHRGGKLGEIRLNFTGAHFEFREEW